MKGVTPGGVGVDDALGVGDELGFLGRMGACAMRRDLGWLLHAVGGAAIALVAALPVPWWLALPGLALFGWIREVLQHDLSLTPHQWLEALAWAAGGALGLGLARLAAWSHLAAASSLA